MPTCKMNYTSDATKKIPFGTSNFVFSNVPSSLKGFVRPNMKILSCVDCPVFGQAGMLIKTLGTITALVKFLASMNSCVSFQSFTSHE